MCKPRRGRSSAHRSDALGKFPFRLVAADFNADGKPDLATADHGSSFGVSVMLGNGNGSFRARAAYQTSSKPADIVPADLNGDGGVRVTAASGDRGGAVTVLLNDGAGRFHRDQAYPSGAIARHLPPQTSTATDCWTC